MSNPKAIALITALGKARGEIDKVDKNKVNNHTKSKYADINDVLKVVLPALSKYEITLLQPLSRGDNGEYYVRTTLVHTPSGEYLECDTPVICSAGNAQSFGSGITYARRYGLVSLLALEAEDDDGNRAVQGASQHQAVHTAQPTSESIAQAKLALSAAQTLEDLGAIYRTLSKELQGDRTILAECQAVKARLLQQNANTQPA